MNSPFVSVGEELKASIASALEPTRVEAPRVNTGFSSVDNPRLPEPQEMPKTEAPSPPQDDFDRRMAKVMAQAQKTQQEREQFAQERATHKSDMEELARWRQLKSIAKEDPVAVAEAYEYRPDEYASVLMEKGSLSPDRRKILEQQRELNELKQWRAQQEQAQQEAQTRALYQNAHSEMETFARQNGEEYDLVSRTKSFDKVLSKIQDHYQKTSAMGEPEILDYAVAFAAVESELEAQYLPVLQSPKLRSKLAPVAAEQQSPTASLLQSAVRKPSGTITSKLRAQSAAPKELSEAERFAKAGEALLSQIYGRR